MNTSVKTKWIMWVAVLVGLFVLASAYLSIDIVQQIRRELFRWAAIVSAFLLGLGILDFMLARLRHLGSRDGGFFHNFISFAIFLTVLIFGFSKQDPALLNHSILKLQMAMEATLAGLISVAMIYGLYRTSRAGGSLLKRTFLLSVMVFLVIFSGILELFEIPAEFQPILTLIRSLPTGGIYGLLVGLSIGALVTGVRVLIMNTGSEQRKDR